MNNCDDAPMFPTQENGENSEEDKKLSLTLPELNALQENVRKNKVLSFCFKASIGAAILIVLFIIFDFIAQANNWNNDIIKDALSVLTYIVTAASGFMFGSNSK